MRICTNLALFVCVVTLVRESSSIDFKTSFSKADTGYFEPQKTGWLGADSSCSIHLYDQNYLWLWADTLIGDITFENGGYYRNWTIMTHSSLAFVNLSESMEPNYWWRITNGSIDPMGVFSPQNPTVNSEYYWPVAGAVASSGQLIVLAVAVVDVGTSFALLGTDVIIVEDFRQPPQQWNYSTSRISWSNSSLTWQVGITIHDGFAYLMGCNTNQKGDPVVLARIREEDLLSFQWDKMEFWSAKHEWTSRCANLKPLFNGPYTESTLFYHSYMKKWFMPLLSVFDDQINPDYNIYIATSDEITGPWKKQAIYSVPPPYNNANVYWNYAAKSHMEYCTQEDQIVLTYNTNSRNVSLLHYDLSIYHPLFLNVTVKL
eukprot:TRINITY_DN14124_c0_g1_i1.p1 TRINITY_DN14124_c0_g1~~TRINITY_DN14124_c0_g1_i1.p1  ORF type:complete len:374 (+),score=17.41 TRINITY_DN14124_c0_g1_i1:218-1339(+)